MKVIELSLEDYKEKHNQLISCMRIEPKIDPWMTEDERITAIQQSLNPELPLHIDWYEREGLIRYVLKDTK